MTTLQNLGFSVLNLLPSTTPSKIERACQGTSGHSSLDRSFLSHPEFYISGFHCTPCTTCVDTQLLYIPLTSTNLYSIILPYTPSLLHIWLTRWPSYSVILCTGEFNFIICCPESFFAKNGTPNTAVKDLVFSDWLGLVVIDEAHCLLQWYITDRKVV